MIDHSEPWSHRVRELADRLEDMTYWEWQWVQKAVTDRFKRMESDKTLARNLAGKGAVLHDKRTI